MRVNRQALIAAAAAAVVLVCVAYATVWSPWQDLRSLDAQIALIKDPPQAPPPDSPEQQQAIPDVLDDARAVSAITAAAGKLEVVSVVLGQVVSAGADAPRVHPYTVTLKADPTELAGFASALQRPLRFEGLRIVGTKGALLLDIVGIESDPVAGTVRVVVNGYSRR